MSKPTGGRGKAAPYNSTHIRLPEDIKPYVELIKTRYFNGTLQDLDTFASCLNQASIPNMEETEQFVEKLLSQKKSARVSLKKLVEFIYRKDR